MKGPNATSLQHQYNNQQHLKTLRFLYLLHVSCLELDSPSKMRRICDSICAPGLFQYSLKSLQMAISGVVKRGSQCHETG